MNIKMNGTTSNKHNTSILPTTYQHSDSPTAATTVVDDENDKDEDNDDEVDAAADISLLKRQPSLAQSILESIRPHHSVLGITLIILGSFFFSCMFLFVKLLEGKANSFTLTFYRGFVEIPLALWTCWRDKENPLGPSSGDTRLWLLARGAFGGSAVLCFFYAIQHLPLPDGVTLQFTTPPFAAAFAVCLVGETWMALDMMGAVVCILGVMLIAHPSWLFGEDEHDIEIRDNNSTGAIAVGLLGASFAGMAYTSVRKIGHGASANVMVLYYGVLSVPVTFLGSKGLIGTWEVWKGGDALFDSVWDASLVVLTGIFAYVGQYLVNLGLQHESAATGTLATCSQIVFTYIFEMAFLHEAINIWSIAGTVLILGFMVIVGTLKMKDADDNIHETVAGEPEELALLFSAEHHVAHRENNRY